jgi:hypothetical protein
VGQENFSRLISEVKKRDLFAIRKLYVADFEALRKDSNSRFAISRHGGRRDSGGGGSCRFRVAPENREENTASRHGSHKRRVL